MSESSHHSEISEKAIFLEALELESPEERQAFLSKRCEGDEVLLDRVRRLLKSAQSTGHPLDAEGFPIAKEELGALSESLEQDSRFMADLGETILRLGDYELIEEIGRGAAGVVYRARQLSLNREVAVKVILGSTWVTSVGRSRFRLEAEASASLNHRYIVPIYEIGQHEGHDFYSMALVSGGTLQQHLEEIRKDRRKAVLMMSKVARTIQLAHAQGILHRDLKPGNILLNENEEPLVSDFGLAYDLRQNIGLTLTGQILGTPQYMAPEQAGAQSGAITIHADIYSIGAILFELLAGRPVLEADSLSEALKCLSEETPDRLRSIDAGIDRDLETIVAKCLEKEPLDRYESAEHLAEDLEAWLDHRPISVRPQPPGQRLIKWIRRKPVEAGLIGSILFLLLSFGIGGPLVAIQQASLRDLADSEREKAEALQRDAEEAREEAVAAADLANKRAFANQRLAYASNMRLISTAAHLGTTTPMAIQTMLTTLRPNDSGDDFRDWEWYYVFGEIHQDPIHFRQKGNVNSLGFSPFGEFILMSNPKGTNTFDTLTRAIGRKFVDGEEHVFSSWSPHGKTIATLGKSGSVKLWDAKTAEVFASLPDSAPSRSISWGADGTRLSALGRDNTIAIWSNEEEPVRLGDPIIPPSELEQIAWSPNGKYLAGVGPSPDVFIWDVEHPDMPLEVYQGHTHPVTTLVWKDDSTWLATGSSRGVIRVWGVPGGLRIMNSGGQLQRGAITALAWDPDGVGLINTLTSSPDLLLLDFSLNTHSIMLPFGHASAVIWNAESHSIVAGDAQGNLSIWRYGLPEVSSELWDANNSLTKGVWTEGGAEIIVRDRSGRLTSLISTTGQELWSTTPELDSSGPSAWSPDRAQLALISHEASGLRLLIVDPRENKTIQSFSLDSFTPNELVWCKENEIYLLSRNGGILKFNSAENRVREELRSASKTGLSFSGISASPDSRWLLVTDERNRIELLSADTGELSLESPAEEDAITLASAHSWHPQSQFFATSDGNGCISIWSVSEKKKIREIKARSGNIGSLAWHPNGNRLASGGENGTVFLWDWENGESMLQLHGQTGFITNLSWNQGGYRLVSTSDKGKVHIWDATPGVILSREVISGSEKEGR